MTAAKAFVTEKGTELPLLNLRGKPYLQIAHRFVWLTEKYDSYTIKTEFLRLEDDYSICKAVIEVLDKEGNVVKTATGTKKETKSDFPDFVEKSETGSCGRALAMLGVGTQFCTQDMDEGKRLADAPIPVAKRAKPVASIPTVKTTAAPSDGGSFNKSSATTEENGW
tara:strand:+ start:9542 stop:10042 length:501 start_codon:yes stop_codon:yes gene_type:complete